MDPPSPSPPIALPIAVLQAIRGSNDSDKTINAKEPIGILGFLCIANNTFLMILINGMLSTHTAKFYIQIYYLNRVFSLDGIHPDYWIIV